MKFGGGMVMVNANLVWSCFLKGGLPEYIALGGMTLDLFLRSPLPSPTITPEQGQNIFLRRAAAVVPQLNTMQSRNPLPVTHVEAWQQPMNYYGHAPRTLGGH